MAHTHEAASAASSRSRTAYTQTPHARTAADNVIRRTSIEQIGFLRMTSELLEEAMAHDEAQLRSMKQELSLIDDAGIQVRPKKTYVQFIRYDRKTKKQNGITRNQDLVYSLARRSFLEQRINLIENSRSHFQQALDATRDAIEQANWEIEFRKFSDAGLDLARILFTPEQLEWINTPYSPNPHHPEDLKHPTPGGLITRSKSEASLGSIAEELGLPFRYDDFTRILYDPLGDSPSRDSVYSDYKFPNLCGGITIHEHPGAFQVNRYGDNALMRLNDYHNFEVMELPGRPVSHDEFTWSFECDLQDQKQLRKLFRRILLPGIDF